MFSFFRYLPRCCNITQNKITSKSIHQSSEILKRNGVVIIPRELILSELNLKISEINQQIEDLIEKFKNNNFFKENSIKFYSPNTLDIHPAILAREGKSFVYTRDGIFFDSYKRIWKDIDNNLLDYYNPDKEIFKNIGIHIYLQKVQEISNEIISSLFKTKKINTPYTNLYIYKNVKYPRCLHVDTHNTMFKVFTSLTNILDIDDGPITYVPKSHKIIGRIRSLASTILSTYLYSDIGNQKNDAVLFGRQESIPIKTRLLDIVIGNQSNVHGDSPYLKKENNFQKLLHVHTFLVKKEK